MTMPHLMNCPHSGDGWCLECVGEMQRLLEQTREAARWLANNRPGTPVPEWVDFLVNGIAGDEDHAMTDPQIQTLAAKIAVELFTDGIGNRADRLQMMHKQPDRSERGGGGWSIEGATARIEMVLRKELPQ